MSIRGKIVLADEWIWASPLMNGSLRGKVDPRCEICLSARCAASWVSIKRWRTRCGGCFDGYAEDARLRDEARSRGNPCLVIGTVAYHRATALVRPA